MPIKTVRRRKLTPLQVAALQYAAGRHDCFPTAAVARRLQLQGLLTWTGPLIIGFRGRRLARPDERGWQLTQTGRECLMRLEEAKAMAMTNPPSPMKYDDGKSKEE